MADIPITQGFNHDLTHMKGYARFSPEALEEMHGLLEKGGIFHFAIGFKGALQEDGTYKNPELVEISLIAGEEPNDPARGCPECLRGILCGKCNRGIGKLDESKERLLSAIKYLEKYGTTAKNPPSREYHASDR